MNVKAIEIQLLTLQAELHRQASMVDSILAGITGDQKQVQQAPSRYSDRAAAAIAKNLKNKK